MSIRRLHIGGQIRKEGWEVLDALQRPEVDHLGNAQDLSRFADGTFDAVYASHVIEHFDYNGPLQAALKEWHRVLSPTGCLYVSFPDLATLANIYTQGKLSIGQKFHVMRMIFGGHIDPYDYHLVGLDHEIMHSMLKESGFATIDRVRDFGLFNDTSRANFLGHFISCNLVAFKS